MVRRRRVGVSYSIPCRIQRWENPNSHDYSNRFRKGMVVFLGLTCLNASCNGFFLLASPSPMSSPNACTHCTHAAHVENGIHSRLSRDLDWSCKCLHTRFCIPPIRSLSCVDACVLRSRESFLYCSLPQESLLLSRAKKE